MPDIDPFAIPQSSDAAAPAAEAAPPAPPEAPPAPEATLPAAAPAVADEVLLASVDVARTALLEITPASTIGAPAGHIVEGERTLSLLFECTMLGYPGWLWTVSLARASDGGPASVLETELMPGEHALTAPDWVPWSDRLADYQASQEAARAGEPAASDEGDEEQDDDELDAEELDDDEIDVGDGDLDGVDIDALHDGDDDDTDDDFDDTGVDAEDVDARDIIGVELATLGLEDDDAEDAETASDNSSPEQPTGTGGEDRSSEDD
jgi:hypothetical protein